ncbi:hypothetical protein BSG1_02425 [Bacillus sp. SG-1]|nr:hypothetical protein BSG1_02425 [Bacillus sp. SG-1]
MRKRRQSKCSGYILQFLSFWFSFTLFTTITRKNLTPRSADLQKMRTMPMHKVWQKLTVIVTAVEARFNTSQIGILLTGSAFESKT